MKTSYILKQITAEGLWTSPVFEHREHQIPQAVIGGWVSRQPRWAEKLDGTFLYGLDGNGKSMERAP